jgi:hypothetical protein
MPSNLQNSCLNSSTRKSHRQTSNNTCMKEDKDDPSQPTIRDGTTGNMQLEILNFCMEVLMMARQLQRRLIGYYICFFN